MNAYKLNTKYKDRLFRLVFRDKKELLEMNLYEHQSTFSPNLPLRGLFYFSAVYKAYIEPVKHKLYFDSKLEILFPQYIIFYNGIEKKPERQELKLSTLFVGNGKGKTPALE